MIFEQSIFSSFKSVGRKLRRQEYKYRKFARGTDGSTDSCCWWVCFMFAIVGAGIDVRFGAGGRRSPGDGDESAGADGRRRQSDGGSTEMRGVGLPIVPRQQFRGGGAPRESPAGFGAAARDVEDCRRFDTPPPHFHTQPGMPTIFKFLIRFSPPNQIFNRFCQFFAFFFSFFFFFRGKFLENSAASCSNIYRAAGGKKNLITANCKGQVCFNVTTCSVHRIPCGSWSSPLRKQKNAGESSKSQLVLTALFEWGAS